MSTISTSATSGNDKGIASYSRSLSSAIDSKKLNIDESRLSTFNLLLALPIFDNQTAPPVAEPVAEPVADQVAPEDKTDSKENSEQDASVGVDDQAALLVAVSQIIVPLTNKIDQNSAAITNAQATAEGAPDSNVATPSILDDSNAIANQPTVPPKELPKVAEPTDSTAIKDIRQDAKPKDDRLDESNQEVNATSNPLRAELTTRPESKKPTDDGAATRKVQTAPIDDEKAALPASVAKSSASNLRESPAAKDDFIERKEAESSQEGNSYSNRRSDRLAASKRGEQSGKSEGNASSGNDRHDDGAFEISVDTTIVGKSDSPSSQTEFLDPTPSILVPDFSSTQALSVTSEPNGAVNQPTLVAAGASLSSTSVGAQSGGDSAVFSNIGGVSGVQGGNASSMNASIKSSAPVSGSSTLTAYQEGRVLNRVLKGLEQLSDNKGQVRLRLHPPELGSLQVTLRFSGQQVSAQIEVEHPTARDLLLKNLPQLQKQLADQNIIVSQFDVQVVDPSQFSQGNGLSFSSSNGSHAGQQEADADRSSRHVDRLENSLESKTSSSMASRPGRASWSRNNGELDVRV
ncbi:MAG: flagellar hook-length control protein FliK [Pirellulaceae bacterium]|nr:flagellar hook-length control protein FliK [Pirellulaceae bacterium]